MSFVKVIPVNIKLNADHVRDHPSVDENEKYIIVTLSDHRSVKLFIRRADLEEWCESPYQDS